MKAKIQNKNHSTFLEVAQLSRQLTQKKDHPPNHPIMRQTLTLFF
jgi:hypothetical protein